MQRLALLAASLIGLAAAGAAHGQTKPRRPPPPPRPAAESVAPPVVTPTPPPLAPVSTRFGGLVGLPPVGDPAPACRAQCSKDRYVCHAGGDATDCDSRWVPCLQTCSAR